MELRKVSESSTKANFSYDKVEGAEGYLYYKDDVRVAKTFDPNDTTVSFGKPFTKVSVEAVGFKLLARAEYPVVVVPPEPPPSGQFGAALPQRFKRPTGNVRIVTTASELAAALNAVNPNEIIQGKGTITGEFRCTRPGPYLLEGAPGAGFTIMGPAKNPSQPLRIESHDIMLHNFAIRGARGASSQGVYLKDCFNIEMVGLDIHSDYHDEISPTNASGVMGIFSSASSHHCYGWYLNIWENGQGHNNEYHPDHAWYMEGDDHWLIGSLVVDHKWGYGVHLYPVGHRRHVVNCTMVGNNNAGIIIRGYPTAISDEIRNCISTRSDDYAYRLQDVSGTHLRDNLAWNPDTVYQVGSQTDVSIQNMVKADPKLDASHKLGAGSPACDKADPTYCPPLLRNGQPRQYADLGSEGRA